MHGTILARGCMAAAAVRGDDLDPAHGTRELSVLYTPRCMPKCPSSVSLHLYMHHSGFLSHIAWHIDSSLEKKGAGVR
jgi:hypothetical protein